MVTTRRQIKSEQERYGGYATKPSRIAVDETELDFDAFPVTETRRGFAPAREEAVEIDQPVYSARPVYPKTAEFVGNPVVAPSRVKKTARRESEDVMPSIRTRAYLEPEAEKEAAPKKRERARLESKTKMMLAVYISVVAVLAVVVIATGIAISGASGAVSALESQIAGKNQILAQQDSELDMLANDTMITGMATEQGMVKADGATEMELIPVGTPVTYEKRTNWFDRFCDWLSHIIGG